MRFYGISIPEIITLEEQYKSIYGQYGQHYLKNGFYQLFDILTLDYRLYVHNLAMLPYYDDPQSSTIPSPLTMDQREMLCIDTTSVGLELWRILYQLGLLNVLAIEDEDILYHTHVHDKLFIYHTNGDTPY